MKLRAVILTVALLALGAGSAQASATWPTHIHRTHARMLAQYAAIPDPSVITPQWAGYVVTGGHFTSASGAWTVPAVTCAPGETSWSVAWVGIDGFDSPTVEQDGTASYCYDGVPGYEAWIAMYGDAAVTGYGPAIPFSNPVSAGDQVSASVYHSGSTWSLTVSDATRGWSRTLVEPGPRPAAAASSAEWVAEDPGVPPVSLSRFGHVTFSNVAAASTGGWSLESVSSPTMFPGPFYGQTFTVSER